MMSSQKVTALKTALGVGSGTLRWVFGDEGQPMLASRALQGS